MSLGPVCANCPHSLRCHGDRAVHHCDGDIGELGVTRDGWVVCHCPGWSPALLPATTGASIPIPATTGGTATAPTASRGLPGNHPAPPGVPPPPPPGGQHAA